MTSMAVAESQKGHQDRRIEMFYEFRAQRDALGTGPEREVLAILLYVLARLIAMDGPTEECAEVEEIVRSGH